jgi:hypothetical protein
VVLVQIMVFFRFSNSFVSKALFHRFGVKFCLHLQADTVQVDAEVTARNDCVGYIGRFEGSCGRRRGVWPARN